jgi:photosystem II stability/assembly factor-like uncharacterized protein
LALRDRLSHSQGHLYQTTNGGQSWTLLKRTGWTGVQLNFLDAKTGWAVACSDAWSCYQDDARHALVKTTDGGQSWQVLEPPAHAVIGWLSSALMLEHCFLVP